MTIVNVCSPPSGSQAKQNLWNWVVHSEGRRRRKEGMKASGLEIRKRANIQAEGPSSLGVGSEPLGVTNGTCEFKGMKWKFANLVNDTLWQPESHFPRACEKLSASNSGSHQVVQPVLDFPDSYMLPIKAVVIWRGELLIFIYGWQTQAHGSILGLGEKRHDDW